MQTRAESGGEGCSLLSVGAKSEEAKERDGRASVWQSGGARREAARASRATARQRGFFSSVFYSSVDSTAQSILQLSLLQLSRFYSSVDSTAQSSTAQSMLELSRGFYSRSSPKVDRLPVKGLIVVVGGR